MRRWMSMLLTVLLLTGCGTAGEQGQDTEPDMAQTAMTVDGEAVSLREWNFYVRMNQMQWEKDELETYGDDMWSLEVDEDGTTLADSLKADVRDLICRTHLSARRAEEYGVELSGEELEQVKERARDFMGAYHQALLEYAGADEDFVYEQLCLTELSLAVEEAAAAEYEPQIPEEDYHREGICYVLVSTTGLRDGEGNLTPFTEEEVEERTDLAFSICETARETGDLKSAAEDAGMTPIVSSMGASNEGDGQEPLMLDAARELAVGEISDPIETEEGWFVVQHTSGYDEESSEYWKDYLTELARQEYLDGVLAGWMDEAVIQEYPEVMDQVNVKIVLKELL